MAITYLKLHNYTMQSSPSTHAAAPLSADFQFWGATIWGIGDAALGSSMQHQRGTDPTLKSPFSSPPSTTTYPEHPLSLLSPTSSTPSQSRPDDRDMDWELRGRRDHIIMHRLLANVIWWVELFIMRQILFWKRHTVTWAVCCGVWKLFSFWISIAAI